jgi:hypothetical protein
MGAKHARDDQESTYDYMEGLKQQPEILDEIKRGLQLLAAQADLDQPVAAAITREIERVAAEVASVAEDSASWYGLCMADSRNRRDKNRQDDPRKGIRQEANANVGKVIRDL